jgi:hypothetical protein
MVRLRQEKPLEKIPEKIPKKIYKKRVKNIEKKMDGEEMFYYAGGGRVEVEKDPFEGLEKPKQRSAIPREDRDLLLSKDWRLTHLYAVSSKKGKLVWFKPNRAQDHFRKHAANRNIILKSRQLGFTTFEIIDSLDDVLFHKNFEALFVSYDQESSFDVFDNKVMLAWKNFDLAKFYDLDTERQNKLRVGFKENKDGTSRSFSSLSVKASGRSGTFHRVHISEFGKICRRYPDKAKEIITGTFPSVPIQGRIDIESTAEGEDSLFAEMFWNAWNRPTNTPRLPTEFKAFFYNFQWDDISLSEISRPDTQIPKEFRERQKRHNELAIRFPHLYVPLDDIQLTYWFYKWVELNKDWNKLFQEYPLVPDDAFRASGQKMFDPQIIDELARKTVEPKEVRGDMAIYEYPIAGHLYAIGADPAEGVGEDSSAFSVIDFTVKKPKVVATYTNNTIQPDIFAFELRAAGFFYGTALIAVERNNTGFATLTKLREIYPEDMIFKEVKEGYEEDKDTHRFGWHTNKSTKPRMLYDIKTAVNDTALDIPSKEMLREMRTYSRDQLASIHAEEGQTQHWDMLMSLAIAFQMGANLMENTQVLEVTSGSQTHQGSSDAYAGI